MGKPASDYCTGETLSVEGRKSWRLCWFCCLSHVDILADRTDHSPSGGGAPTPFVSLSLFHSTELRSVGLRADTTPFADIRTALRSPQST